MLPLPHLKEEKHGIDDVLEVEDVVDGAVGILTHVFEERHSHDGVDEDDEEEDDADVEEGGQRHQQGEEKSSESLGSLYEAQHAANSH